MLLQSSLLPILPAGCIVIVFNYTGDRLNFGLAVAKGQQENMKVE